MNKRYFYSLYILTILCMSVNCFAGVNDFKRITELFSEKKYVAVLVELDKLKESGTIEDFTKRESLDYYYAVCLANTNRNAAEQIIDNFIYLYPRGLYSNDAKYQLANIYTEEGNYPKAINTYKGVNVRHLPQDQRNNYRFNLGYALFAEKKYKEAQYYLEQVRSSLKNYSEDATYFMAYINYINKKYPEALSMFQSIENAEKYNDIVPYYIVQIEFIMGNYNYVMENGEKLLEKSKELYRPEICRIVGESFFHDNNYLEAIRFLDQYMKFEPNPTREARYLAGYSHYMIREFKNAVNHFSAIVEGSDQLSQNAYYHLGDCYIRLDNKQGAVSAFSMAASYDYDKIITEDALFNFIKLQYEIGTKSAIYNQSIAQMTKYIETYPSSQRTAQIREMLLMAYLNSNNYEAAMGAIKNVKNPDNSVKIALQKVSYMRGIEYFANKDYKNAFDLFNVSLDNAYSAKYTALSKYWKAEVLYADGKYASAIPLYKEYIQTAPKNDNEYIAAHYNIAYSLFNMGEYQQAAQWFDKLILFGNIDQKLISDSYNRKGDICFASRDFKGAIENYSNSKSGGSGGDYADFQTAVTYGLMSKNNDKISILKEIIKKGGSNYTDDAIFELGRTYVRQDDYAGGEKMMRELLDNHPQSPLSVAALNQLGLIYQNRGMDDKALECYKDVVSGFPDSPEAKDAMIGVKSIYVAKGDIQSYFSFAESLGLNTSIEGVEKERLIYNAAENLYMEGKYADAIDKLLAFTKEYPSGSYTANATFYLADCLQRTSREDEAYAEFRKVCEMSQNPFTTNALKQAAKIAYNKGEYSDSYQYYTKMSESNPNVSIEAMEGAIDAAIMSENKDIMREVSLKVLDNEKSSTSAINKALWIRGSELMSEGKYNEALTDLRKASKDLKSREGSEARYLVCQILYDTKKYDSAEKEILSFSESGTPYQYWLAKSFVVLGDVYVAKGDNFQAKATYQSIIDGYNIKDDGIIETATKKHDDLK